MENTVTIKRIKRILIIIMIILLPSIILLLIHNNRIKELKIFNAFHIAKNLEIISKEKNNNDYVYDMKIKDSALISTLVSFTLDKSLSLDEKIYIIFNEKGLNNIPYISMFKCTVFKTKKDYFDFIVSCHMGSKREKNNNFSFEFDEYYQGEVINWYLIKKSDFIKIVNKKEDDNEKG